jgi:hypothetical protein
MVSLPVAVGLLVVGGLVYAVLRSLSIPKWVPYLGSSEDENLTLREFIYLDEVSVVSLLASLTREITESRTETESSESQRGSKFRLKAFTSKIPGFGASHERLNIDRDTEEVVRKSEIQSKFDELYSETSGNFQLDSDKKRRTSVSELEEGGVMEIEIEFSAHELYHFYRAYQYLFDVFEEHIEELDQEQKQIVELIGSLFGDQIPVVGEAVNYRVVDDEILSSNLVEDDMDDEPLEIVGTLNPEMLWQDPSTFLYEENQFTAYVRVPEAKLQEEWDPVKLTRVIRSISEEVGDQLRGMIEFGLKQAKEDLNEADLEDDEEPTVLPQDPHETYFDRIEEMEDIEIREEQRREFVEEALAETVSSSDTSEMEIQIGVLKQVTDLVEEEEDVNLDRGGLSDLRVELIGEQGGQIIDAAAEKGNYLEVSFVAIYW